MPVAFVALAPITVAFFSSILVLILPISIGSFLFVAIQFASTNGFFASAFAQPTTVKQDRAREESKLHKTSAIKQPPLGLEIKAQDIG